MMVGGVLKHHYHHGNGDQSHDWSHDIEPVSHYSVGQGPRTTRLVAAAIYKYTSVIL